MDKKLSAITLLLLLTAAFWILKLEVDKSILYQKLDIITEKQRKIEEGFLPISAKNSCYINALFCKEALEVKGRLEQKNYIAKILYTESWKKIGHASCLFYAEGRWRLYTGDYTLPLIFTDPNSVPAPELCALALDKNFARAEWMP